MKLINLIPLREIDFRNQDQFDDYNSQHELRPDTKVTIAGKQTTAGQAAQSSSKVKGASVFGNGGGVSVFDEKEPSEEIFKAIQNRGHSSITTLYRKNRNGKIIKDVNFNSKEDITTDVIQKTADRCGIDLNLINKLGVDTNIKDKYGKNQPISELMLSLIFTDIQRQQFAPGGVVEDAGYYEAYSNTVNAQADAIKKGIDPDRIQAKADKKVAKAESDKETLYNVENTKDLANALSKVKDKIIFTPTLTTKDIAKVANKYKIDVNRILQHPEIFSDISGFTPDDEFLKAMGYKSLSDYALAQLGNTIYFGKDGDTDSMDELSNFQLAYPLKYKNLSDDEWSKTVQNELDNPTTVDGGIRNFLKKERDNADNSTEDISKANNENQSKWVKEQSAKNKNYVEDMFEYQQMIDKSALSRIDTMLKSDPPPPVKAKALYRGMAMTPRDYSMFMKSFSEGSTVDLPISSFSLDARTASEFTNNVGNANALLNKGNNQSIMIKVVNSNNTFNGFCMNANINNVSAKKPDATFGDDFDSWEAQQEVLLPSNNKYKVLKTEAKKMQGGRSFTIITLEQVGIKNEIRLKEFINNDETDMLKKHLQYPNRTSLLYKTEQIKK
jgi:hypothetical protein